MSRQINTTQSALRFHVLVELFGWSRPLIWLLTAIIKKTKARLSGTRQRPTLGSSARSVSLFFEMSSCMWRQQREYAWMKGTCGIVVENVQRVHRLFMCAFCHHLSLYLSLSLSCRHLPSFPHSPPVCHWICENLLWRINNRNTPISNDHASLRVWCCIERSVFVFFALSKQSLEKGKKKKKIELTRYLMLSIGNIRNNMTLKSFSKKVDISIYIHEVPHKPDICCIDIFDFFFFFFLMYFILSGNILICNPPGEVWMSLGAEHASTSFTPFYT